MKYYMSLMMIWLLNLNFKFYLAMVNEHSCYIYLRVRVTFVVNKKFDCIFPKALSLSLFLSLITLFCFSLSLSFFLSFSLLFIFLILYSISLSFFIISYLSFFHYTYLSSPLFFLAFPPYIFISFSVS